MGTSGSLEGGPTDEGQLRERPDLRCSGAWFWGDGGVAILLKEVWGLFVAVELLEAYIKSSIDAVWSEASDCTILLRFLITVLQKIIPLVKLS